jgi:SAM-dependent methyltransferase
MAESFGTDAERYDRTRPSYPDAMVERIVAASPGLDFLDVGCGTGIASRQFQAAGCRVLGVDVDARMADQARQSGLAVEVSKFESWEPAGRTFDAVVAGQTWHWVDPVAGVAKAAEVLRPGGRLALFWNVFQPTPEVAEAFFEAHVQAIPDAPLNPWAVPVLDLYKEGFAKTAEGIRETGTFGEPEQWQWSWERPYPRDEWLDQLATFGGSSQLPPDKLAALRTAMGAAIDTMGGTFTMPYLTVVITAAR